jgi:hypothetical protein
MAPDASSSQWQFERPWLGESTYVECDHSCVKPSVAEVSQDWFGKGGDLALSAVRMAIVDKANFDSGAAS